MYKVFLKSFLAASGGLAAKALYDTYSDYREQKYKLTVAQAIQLEARIAKLEVQLAELSKNTDSLQAREKFRRVA